MIGGLRIYTNPYLTEACADFSRSRSPSRALRRWKQRGVPGHGIFERPSRKVVMIPGNHVICHPDIYNEIKRITDTS